MKCALKNKQWQSFLSAFGPLDNEEVTRTLLVNYLSALLRENENINLTSITDWDEGVWKHLFDSLFVLRGEPSGVVLDWGTGGGTPGIPLAAWAKGLSSSKVKSITLLDSVGKKVRAVQSFLDVLGLADLCVAIQARGEEYVQHNRVDTVVMRAVAPPERVLGWMSPKVAKWIFLVGPQSSELWEKSLVDFKKRGFFKSNHIKESLPNGLGERHILVFERSHA